MYPGTIVRWHDNSAIITDTLNANDSGPVFLVVSSFDKGPEKWNKIYGQSFFDLYGSKMNFAAHGQPAIQAANMISNGATLLVKRLVASDAELANLILVAKVKQETVLVPAGDDVADEDKVTIDDIIGNVAVGDGEENPEEGGGDVEPTEPADEPTGDEPSGDEPTDPTPTDEPTNPDDPTPTDPEEPGDEPTDPDTPDEPSEPEVKYYVVDETASSASIVWTAVSVAGVINGAEVQEQAEALRVDVDPVVAENEDSTVSVVKESDYPLIILTDNGRGVSNKSVKITADYSTSTNLGDFIYSVYVYEGTQIIEKIVATMNPDTVYGSKGYGLSADSGAQVTFLNVEGAYDAYVDNISSITGIDIDTLKSYDLINLHTNKNAEMEGIKVDPESVDLGSTYGINLENGSNGEFGDKPFGTEAYIQAAIEALDGTYNDCIFDVDEYKIGACFDANYPLAIKEAIAELVTFREDFTFFRDLNTDVRSYSSILARLREFKTNNKFIANYLTNYQIYDPNTRKRIRVTMMYDFAAAMVQHFVTGPYRPCAGMANNMYLDSAIEGTVNYTPRITPSVNQKQLLEDLRVNYAIFQQGRCVVQSLYTSQEAYTQLSYINNVLAVQQVVRALRTACPRQRYTFVTGNDFSSYEEACNNVLSYYTANFAELTFSYQQDALQAAQKIFYATISFRFNNWAQTEIFDIYALPTEV